MIAAIELAMLARLKAVADTGALGFQWRTLATFPDNWEDYLASDSVIATPAAWVVFAGWDRAEVIGDDLHVQDAHFGLMVADENSRPNEQYQRHGGDNPAKEPGSYRMVEGAAISLAGNDLGLLSRGLLPGPLRPVAPTAASKSRRMSRFAVDFTCDFIVTLAGDDPAAIEQLHANWDIPAYASPFAVDRDAVRPGAQLPDDFHADATDHVDLTEEP